MSEMKLQYKYFDPDTEKSTYRDVDFSENCHSDAYFVLVSVNGKREPLPLVLLAGASHPAYELCKKFVEKSIREGWDFWDRNRTNKSGWHWDKENSRMVVAV